MSRIVDVREEPGRVAIVLRPYTLWQAIVIPIAQVVALVIVVAVREPHSQQDRVVTALIGLAVGLVLGSLLSWMAYLLIGREEIVAVSGTQLLIDHQVLRHPELRRRRTYAIDRIVNLRAVGKPANTLAFDYNGSPVQFGRGVAGPDADRVLQALAAALPALASREPTSTPAAAAMASEPRAWSRVTLLIAALSVACLVEVVLAWPLDPTKMTPQLAIALISGGFIPAWAFIIWILESRAFWRSRTWFGRVALALFLASYFVPPFSVMSWVVDNLLSPFRSVNRHDLGNIFLVNMFLGIGGVVWAVYRADKRGWILSEVRAVSRPKRGQ
jgi:hypothetical protein